MVEQCSAGTGAARVGALVDHLVGFRKELGYLTGVGAIPEQGFVVPGGPGRPLLERYRRYLETERGAEGLYDWLAAERSAGKHCAGLRCRVRRGRRCPFLADLLPEVRAALPEIEAVGGRWVNVELLSSARARG